MFGDGSTVFLILGILLNVGGLVFLFYSIYQRRRPKTKRSPYGPRDDQGDREEV